MPETATERMKEFKHYLTQAPIVAQPADEDWAATMERMGHEGRIAEIAEETWWYFLEVLPPKFHGGGWFAFAEGQEPLRIFWRQAGKHFVRQLSWDETWKFCDASGLPRSYGH